MTTTTTTTTTTFTYTGLCGVEVFGYLYEGEAFYAASSGCCKRRVKYMDDGRGGEVFACTGCFATMSDNYAYADRRAIVQASRDSGCQIPEDCADFVEWTVREELGLN